ncbi:hypothetical protein CRENBAI_000573, partial [Crenichthys baileyi]
MREGVHEGKDESNALQQRTVTEQAFIWAETAGRRKNAAAAAAALNTALSLNAPTTAGDKLD